MSVPLRPVSTVVCLFALAVISGCERSAPLEWESSQLVQDLASDELRDELNVILKENSGSVADPLLVSNSKAGFDFSLHLKHGQAVYMKRCVQCHGVTGDGNGPAAEHLYPRPRDYTKAIFKFTSTPYGSRPRKDDLIRTVRRGVVGTSMPAFDRISDKDVDAVVDYVMVLAQRGELEFQLAMEADASEELDPDYVEEYIDDVINGWTEAQAELTHPLTPQPVLTEELAQQGRQAFLTKGCSKCHGEDGRGHTKDNIGKDSWGHATRAADLTSGMLRGGQTPIDVYRRILNGINGTPMPGFGRALQDEPETIWQLVAYVLQVSNRRRFSDVTGDTIPAGLIKPYETAANIAAAGGGDSDDADESVTE